MNIEELELSLRSEFKGQMNSLIARTRQDVTDLQARFEEEFRRQREQMDASFEEIVSRMPESFPLDSALKSSITEHLRLARDEGAQIAATAFGEAEKLRTGDSAAGSNVGHDTVRDAINDISSKRSQAAILTALVDHASHFAPRGAFFILKNDNFMGWKLFGEAAANDAVREVKFAASFDSMLSSAVGSLATVRSEFGERVDDLNFLEPLGFGEPAEMYAIPLSARGRGVAVLYADRGDGAGAVNVEALETLVRVAGLTVELLAAAQTAKPQAETTEKAEAKPASQAETAEADQPAEEQPRYEFTTETFNYVEPKAEEAAAYEVETTTVSQDAEPAAGYEFESNASYEFEPTASYDAAPAAEQVETEDYSAPAEEATVEPAVFEPVAEVESSNGFEFSSGESYGGSHVAEPVEAVATEVPHVEFAAEEVAVTSNGNGYVQEAVAAPVQPEPIVPAARPSRRDRNMDLPIEVAEEERKLHNDARRFARLLVSEIKLYNEQEVIDGRANGDLYLRLKEGIDRSREMYEKRVQPAVASKFDYFHYELVGSLAEGDDGKFGAGYPGASV